MRLRLCGKIKQDERWSEVVSYLSFNSLRTILQAAWHVLSKGVEYQERGGDYFDRINSEQTKTKLIKRLERLGYEVDLKPKQATV